MRNELIVALALICCPLASVSQAQDAEYQAIQARLEAQAAEIEALRMRLDRHDAIYESAPPSARKDCAGGPPLRRLPVVVEATFKPSCTEKSEPEFYTLRFYADYDKGFMIRPFDAKRHPFELKIAGWTQIRHHAFARDVETWTDNAGVTRPVRNRNALDIERARLQLSGFALDQRLTYFVHLDGDTDGDHVLDFFDYWWAWNFTDDLQVQMGKRKVPGSRQWILGARNTRMIDRPLACDFFRPDRTVGVTAVTSIGETDSLEVMLGNGYQTSNLANSATDNQFIIAASHYFDPWGNFGGPLVDYEYSCDPLARIGHSFVYAPQSSDTLGIPLDETDFLRLADGTRLTQAGALAPGVTVSDFDIVFYGVDCAVKWRGWSVNAEGFFRWLEQIEGNGTLPVDSIFQRGFYVEGGTFLMAKKLDVNVRYSEVTDPFGTASEYVAGVNWYPLDNSRMKVSFDVTLLDGSPLQNTTSDILVGDDGLLFRTQFQAEF